MNVVIDLNKEEVAVASVDVAVYAAAERPCSCSTAAVYIDQTGVFDLVLRLMRPDWAIPRLLVAAAAVVDVELIEIDSDSS